MPRKRIKKVRTPREAKTFAQICEMPRDNWSYGDFWMMVVGPDVVITKQRSGEMSTEKIKIPRRVFNRFVDIYNTGSAKRT